MKIIVKCWTPECYDAVTHAVIEFDHAMVKDLLEKLRFADKVAKRYRGMDTRFMGLEFDNYDPDFVNFGDPTEIGLENDDSLDAGFSIIPAKFENYEFDVTSMRPVMQMVMAGDVPHHRLPDYVPEGRVYWYGFDKHGNAGCRAETYSLYEKDLREIMSAITSNNLGLTFTP